MNKQKIVTRRNYAAFIRELFISLPENNLIRIVTLISVTSILLAALAAPLCSSCMKNHLFSLIHLTIVFPIVLVFHEFIHYAILDTDVKITFNPNFIKIEPLDRVSAIRTICSALAGPLIPFLFGLIIYYMDPINLFGIYFPLLIYIFILPFDILSAFGVEIE